MSTCTLHIVRRHLCRDEASKQCLGKAALTGSRERWIWREERGLIRIQWIWTEGMDLGSGFNGLAEQWSKGRGMDRDSMREMNPTSQERDLELDAELDLVARYESMNGGMGWSGGGVVGG